VKRLIPRMTAATDRVAASGVRVLQGRLVRRLWLAGASLLAVLGLGFGTLQAASLVAHEERSEVTSVAAGGVQGLVVDNRAGSVELIGVAGADEITVRARISDGLRATGHQVDTRDGVVRVTGSCPVFGSEWCEVDYTVEVPPGLFVDVAGRDGVSASNLTGGLTARSSAAAVDLLRVGGDVTVSANHSRVEGRDLTAADVDASANNGRLTLEFAASPRHVTARANHGRVDITLPDEPGVVYATDTEANQGTVRDEIRQDPGSDRSITVEANRGDATISYAPR
jgi:hypothetical protein